MDSIEFLAGIDWGSQAHQVCILDNDGGVLGERAFEHSGEGLARMADWIVKTTGAGPHATGIAIEVPNGPVVETMLERGFMLHSLNPKQLDRFRDRFSPSGAKDDRRDALVLADALRTDRKAFRRLDPAAPQIIELREWTRIADHLTGDRTRIANRARQQLWRYYPQLLKVEGDMGRAWIRELWSLAPTPAKARRVRVASIAAILKRNRIRRIDAGTVLRILREPAVPVAPGTADAAAAHLKVVFAQLDLIGGQLTEAHRQMDRLIGDLPGSDDQTGTSAQRDAEILNSLPGVGRTVLATLLTEAYDPLRRRDYHALRCLSGVAPVTKRSGKSLSVIRRLAAHNRLRCAMHHWGAGASAVFRASRRARTRIAASCSHASELSTVFSKSFASRRQRFSQAKVRSTTQRRCSTSKPSDFRSTTSISSRTPSRSSAERSLPPA